MRKKAPVKTDNGQEKLKRVAEVFVDAFVVGGPNAIDLQEFQGQSSLVVSDTLPASLWSGPAGFMSYEDNQQIARTALESWSIKFLGPVPGDPIFQFVQLPTGWGKVPTNHSMLSMLVDDQGRERARIIYKAAYYDRHADLVLQSRYGIHESCYDMKWVRSEDEELFEAYVTDGGVVFNGHRVIYTSDVVVLEGDRQARYRATREAMKQAEEWLTANYPEFQNPTAYWY